MWMPWNSNIGIAYLNNLVQDCSISTGDSAVLHKAIDLF